MKRTDTFTKITAALLFTAIVAYIGVYIARSMSNSVQTAPAVVSTIRDTGPAVGIIIRDELVIESDKENIDITAAEGERVAKGAVVAMAYGSDGALARASRIRELELEIQRAETLLGSLSTAEDLSARDAAVRSAVLELSAAVARHELADLDRRCLSLKSLVFRQGNETMTQGKLESLKSELAGLKASYSPDTVEITAQSSGVFSRILDGFEHLEAGSVSGFSPSRLRELMDDRREVSPKSIGKLVCSFDWHFAAIMPEEDAERLQEGRSARLELGRYYSEPVTARVADIGPSEKGERVVLFNCSQALAETLAMRQVSAEVLFDEYSGIRVPKKAVHVEEDGSLYVYTLTGMLVEKKYVDIVYEAEDYYLMEAVPPPGTSADAVVDTSSFLREGNEIIVSGKKLYDGKVLE
jgi:putative membrane fusion protein